MPTKVKRIYLESIIERYKKSTKYKEGLILNEFCQGCGYERKYAIRILNGAIKPRFKKPGPASKYEHVVDHIYYLWNAMNKMCSKKMVKAFEDWLPFYKQATASELLLIKKISPMKPESELWELKFLDRFKL